MLLTHYAIRKVMTDAAEEADANAERLSFPRALRRQITGRRIAPPSDTRKPLPTTPDRRK